jgi:hypothetical protein
MSLVIHAINSTFHKAASSPRQPATAILRKDKYNAAAPEKNTQTFAGFFQTGTTFAGY